MKRAFAATIPYLTLLPLWGHPDDPKAQYTYTRIESPAYRADISTSQLTGTFESNGFELLSWLPLTEFTLNPSTGSDCWGYVSPSGREYALFTHSEGLAVVEVTNPGNAQIVAEIDGATSLWHDVKVYSS